MFDFRRYERFYSPRRRHPVLDNAANHHQRHAPHRQQGANDQLFGYPFRPA